MKNKFASLPDCIAYHASQMACEMDAEDAVRPTVQRLAQAATAHHTLARITAERELQLLGLTLN